MDSYIKHIVEGFDFNSAKKEKVNDRIYKDLKLYT